MRELEDGSKVFIRSDRGYYVEHVAANGMVADTIQCDSFAEARAVFAEHPANW